MKQKEVIGAFIKVPIDETSHTYGRIIHNYVYAFYDFATDSENHDWETVEKSSILFKVMVHRSAVTKGFWKIVGNKPLADNLKKAVPFFIQEIGSPNDCWIDLDGIRSKVEPINCVGVERFASWEHQHVEQRLRDYYNGVPNKFAESMMVNAIR